MNNIKCFAVIGGDNRQIYMAEYLKAKGYSVKKFALPESEFENIAQLKEAVSESDAVILPLPVTKDGKNLNTLPPFNICVDEIIPVISTAGVIFGGMIKDDIKTKLKEAGARVFDYFGRDDVTLINAIPTSQGVLKVIFDNVNYTVHSSRCAVFGFGRTGKIIAENLHSLGADVTVCARKSADIALAFSKKYSGCYIKDFYGIAQSFDFIVNTVPANIIDFKILSSLRKDCFIIDVASAPYGLDFSLAEKLGIKALLCPSLPGKTAPKTAGKIIADGIINILGEEGYE